MRECVAEEALAGGRSADADRRRGLANRVESEALRRLANVGWTDEARAASLAARRANAAARNAGASKGGAFAFAPQSDLGIRADGRYRTENGKTVFIPDGASSMPPAGNGDIVKTGDSILLIVNGKPVRIGSTKVLSLGPDGNLLLTTRSGTVDLGKPDKWGNFTGSKGRAGNLVRVGNTVYARLGGLLVSLEDGSMRWVPVKPRTDSRGVVIHEPPARAGLGLTF